MISSLKQFADRTAKPIKVLDKRIEVNQYCTIDFSSSNVVLSKFDVADPVSCQKFIEGVLHENNALVAYGGYLEKRNLYNDKPDFHQAKGRRNIHLGVDFWAKAGTKVLAPVKGVVHSFKNNAAMGDYGPTIILKHEIDGFIFHTLYGHLSLAAIENIHIDQEFEAGNVVATLGTPDVNVNYAPHLHFQIIIDMEGKKGDYPGVCAEDDLEYYAKNCPDPNILLQMIFS